MSKEVIFKPTSGWSILFLNLLMYAAAIGIAIYGFTWANLAKNEVIGLITAGIVAVLGIAAILTTAGFFALLPNESAVMTLFGDYRGTTRDSGFHWANPFITKRKVSLRSRNLEGTKLKVNDKQGNPIEIGIVVVWHVQDTVQAIFDVDNYEEYVRVQSESAVRHMASEFAYDHGEGNEQTLRSSQDAVVGTLVKELQDRCSKAGVMVEEARLTHLAYAPEIAGVMLRRQQAEAVIAARQKIVHGAVSMVKMALEELKTHDVVHLDDERKAAMVSNLLVVLCGETEVHPVVNAGTLYN